MRSTFSFDGLTLISTSSIQACSSSTFSVIGIQKMCSNTLPRYCIQLQYLRYCIQLQYLTFTPAGTHSMDQLAKVAKFSPLPVRAGEFSFATRVRSSRPASPCSFSTLRLNLVLTHVIPPDFRDGVHLLYRQPPSGQFRDYQVTQLRTDDIHCCEPRRHRASSPQGSSSNG